MFRSTSVLWRAEHRRPRVATVWKVLSIALLSSCSTAPEPPTRLEPPRVTPRVSLFWGSSLSGPLPAPVVATVEPAGVEAATTSGEGPAQQEPGPGSPLLVRVEWFALDTPPPGELQPLEAEAEIVTVSRQAEVVESTPWLTAGGRLAHSEAAMKLAARLADGRAGPPVSLAVALAEEHGWIPPYATARFSLSEEDTGGDAPRCLEIQVEHQRPQTASGDNSILRVALVVEGAPRANGDGTQDEFQDEIDTNEPTAESAPPAHGASQREVLVLRPTDQATSSPMAIVAPSPFVTGDAVSIVALVHFAAKPEKAGFSTAVLQAAHEQADVDLAPAVEVSAPPTPAAAPVAWQGLTSAFVGLRDRQRQRRALVFLADATGASFASDMGLTASDEIVNTLCQAIVGGLETRRLAGPEELGWIIEQAAVRGAVKLGTLRDMPPELDGLLAVHFGQVGRDLALLEELATAMPERDQFVARVLTENTIYLEDHSPAARVRAFDWLSAQGLAPPNYAPFAPLKERRKALAAAEAPPTITDPGTPLEKEPTS